LTLALDPDGFYKPVVDRAKCNECGRCQRACPVIPDERSSVSGARSEPVAFGAWASNEAVRNGSSSGGVFSELARAVIEGGGAVTGCVWGENWTPEHRVARAWPGVEPMRGSKYVPSRVGLAYQETLDALNETGGPVLFSGTPCQVAAMERALSPAQRSRTLLVDFICHGVPSLRGFHRYLGELFDGDAVARFTFRDKTLGWLTIRAESAGGRLHLMPLDADAFGRGFAVEHLFQMEACYACQFASIPRSADVTLADIWGCPTTWHDRRGVSLVLANTDAGLAAIQATERSGRVVLKGTEFKAAVARNPRATGGAYAVPKNRRAFLDGLARGEPYRRLSAKYFPGKATLLWQAFLGSEAKGRFLTDFIVRRIRRLIGKSA
jgi:coenzyme F420-reducing hydrogenase beta subunit